MEAYSKVAILIFFFNFNYHIILYSLRLFYHNIFFEKRRGFLKIGCIPLIHKIHILIIYTIKKTQITDFW